MAFKLYFYLVHWQQVATQTGVAICCEWLSNCIFIWFIDNLRFFGKDLHNVVNGFQIVFLSGSLTTLKKTPSSLGELWMAFKLYFYLVHWQPVFLTSSWRPGCEWLSNCIFIWFIDNEAVHISEYYYVVNGFQIVFLSGSLTTPERHFSMPVRLWMAFKLYFYLVHWQLRNLLSYPYNGCEWLSNCIFIWFIDNT